MAIALIKRVRDIFLGPSVHKDDATADAVQAAISMGALLATDIRIDLEEAAESAELDISSALDTPLDVIEGGSGDAEPGSLLRAVCIGTVAAVGFRELYFSPIAGSQTEVIHAEVARAIAAWEVGQDSIGHRPNPWQGGTHFLWPAGTLSGGKTSVANKLMESFIATGDTPREENAKYFAQIIIASLGLASPICTNPRKFPFLYQLGLGGGKPILPESAVDTVAERILAIDLFWPSYLEGKEVLW